MRSARVWWGILLIAVGLLFLMDTAGVWDFRQIFRTWWPALLILWGFLILRRRAPRTATGAAWTRAGDTSSTGSAFSTRGGSDGDRLDDNAVFGEVNVRHTSKNFKGGSVSTVFGDVHVDLSEVRCAEGEQALNVNGVFGNVSVVLPPGQACSVSASTLLGTVRVGDEESRGFSPNAFRESPDYATAPRKLRLRVSQVFGDLRVRM